MTYDIDYRESKKNSPYPRATPYSSERYYPVFLANGKDCVVVDYSSSNYVSMNGHSHFERHQGSPCGWYKASYRKKDNVLQILFASGVQVFFNGAPAEPCFYEQKFDPFTATSSSLLSFKGGVKVRVQGYLTSESLWCEKTTVLDKGSATDLKIGYYVNAPISFMQAVRLPSDCSFEATAEKDSITFSYTFRDRHGKGFVIPSRPFDELSSGIWDGKIGYFTDIDTGFTVTRFTACCDDDTESLQLEYLRERAVNCDCEEIRREHTEKWQKYFATSSINIPDKRLEYVYYLSRYVVKAAQHPETGLITCGYFPNHWGGDVCCSYDADFSQKALASSGNIEEVRKYVSSYEYVAVQGYKILSEHGMKGTTFLGWVNCLGEYINHVDPFTSIVSTKPVYGAYVFIAIYDLWKKDRSLVTENMYVILRDTITFMRENMLRYEDDRIYLVPVKAGTEAGFVVKVDTLTQLLYSVCFKICAKMLSDDELAVIGDKLYAGLENNYDSDGALLPFENANYYGGLQFSYYLWTYPEPVDFVSVEKALESAKTPWGLSFDQTTESYRHWPWIQSMAALCYMRAGYSEMSMKLILGATGGMSATGALPEKIRIDGEPVNYWYTSTHSLLVWALNDAFAFSKSNDEIMIAYGLCKPWQSFSCKGISLDDSVSISYEVKDGAFISIEIVNGSRETKKLKLCCNKNYRNDIFPKEITLSAGEKYTADAKCR